MAPGHGDRSGRAHPPTDADGVQAGDWGFAHRGGVDPRDDVAEGAAGEFYQSGIRSPSPRLVSRCASIASANSEVMSGSNWLPEQRSNSDIVAACGNARR